MPGIPSGFFPQPPVDVVGPLASPSLDAQPDGIHWVLNNIADLDEPYSFFKADDNGSDAPDESAIALISDTLVGDEENVDNFGGIIPPDQLDAPAGFQSTKWWYKVTGLTRESAWVSVTSVPLPSAPAAPFNISNNIPGTTAEYDSPAQPANGDGSNTFDLFYNRDSAGWNQGDSGVPINTADNQWEWSGTGALPVVSFQIRFGPFPNIYGSGPAGAAGNIPLV